MRHFVRHRDSLIRQAASQLQLIQKGLVEMNLRLQNVVSDISGDTGMKIVRAICTGERDPTKLAAYRDPRCKNTREVIEKSLIGKYKQEVVFCLKQALETYDHYQIQISHCNDEIEAALKSFNDKNDGKPLQGRKRKKTILDSIFKGSRTLWINLLKIPGLNTKTAPAFIAEIGPCVDRRENAKHFSSWLGLSPIIVFLAGTGSVEEPDLLLITCAGLFG